MRLIDADALLEWYAPYNHTDEPIPADVLMYDVRTMPTIAPAYGWISVEDGLPELPDGDWCSIMVITAQKGNSKSRPMIYERAIVRGKRVERWKYCWDKIADETPDYWMYLPEPPKR